MIEYLNSDYCYSDRHYLHQWFDQDILCVTDNDFINLSRTRTLLEQHPNPNRILDITHNPCADNRLPLYLDTILTNTYDFFYNPKPGFIFFPLFLWMYSLRTTLWWPWFCFDQPSQKTQALMCLNNRPRPHRTHIWSEFNRRGIIDQCAFSFTEPVYYEKGQYSYPYPLNILGEDFDLKRNDVGINHPVYRTHAVNLITETATDISFISEKTCKPFVARQIPIIVSSVGINKFLTDVGLDMFSDIVPWTTWDDEPDVHLRVTKIVDFVESWLRSGTMLADYHRVLPRVEANKRYFHSEAFRNRIMVQMDTLI